MNLFSETQERPEIAKEFDNTWWNELGDYICNSEKFDRLLIDIDEYRKTRVIYPEEKDIFRIFKLLPLNKIKVVVVGQDPYHNGNADGIAFSCKQTLSPSLKQILFAMTKDLVLPVKKEQPIQLDYLVNQGVFFYNPILTVESGKPLSHEYRGWEDFSREVFNAIRKQDEVVYLLWGKKAQDYVGIVNNRTSLILSAEHPAAAAWGKRVWTVNHFSEVNKFLKSKGKEEIKWLI